MKIAIKKKTPYHYEYITTRENKPIELINLETKAYFLHDMYHFVVERNLQFPKGFWGKFALGFSFKELFGKENAQTTELRFIEQIVGPVQSVFCGYIPKENFEEPISHLDFKLPENILSFCLDEINAIVENWLPLPSGQQLKLEWAIKPDKKN